MMKKKVIVIGGGIAGLSAGIYAIRCGFDVTILEGHGIAGGNCTSWKRGDYLFEGGMHWLGGADGKEPINKAWHTVGALDDSVVIHTPEPFMEYHHNGTPVRIYRNVDETERHFLELSPPDEKKIRKLCGDIRKLRGLSVPIFDLRGVKVTKKERMPLASLFSALSALRVMRKYSGSSGKDAVTFTHEGLRDMFRSFTNDGLAFMMLTFGSLANGDGGFPEGGSLPFVARIVKRFTDMGGELLCGTHVEKVTVKDGKMTGVITSSGTMTADAVIVASDTMTADRLFDIPLRSPWLDVMRRTAEPTMVTFISLGINADLRKYHKYTVFKTERPIALATREYEFLAVNNYASDPVYSPNGRTAMTIQLSGDTYDFWRTAKEKGVYEEEKKRIAAAVIDALASHIPETKGKVEVCDVATPLTYERYCGNWKGSWMTEMTPDMKFRDYPAVIKGLSGVYFAGQRMMPPGGLPAAVMTGRAAVQYLCRDTGTIFVSEE